MPKTKDGFYKDHQGLLNNEYVLLAGGGHLKIGNAVNNIPLSNNSLNIGLDADKLDGYHANELFQSFTNGENNVTNIKIGDTTLGLAIDADQLDGHHASYFQIATSKSYNSVNTMPSGNEGWYNIFTIGDNTIGTCICNIKAYAHSSLTFIVSKGYRANGTLQILQYNSSSNGNYFYVKGVRLLDDGKVQALFNKTSSPTTNIDVTINIFSTTGQLVPNDILTLETGNPTVISSLLGTHGKATTDIVGNASTSSKWETPRTFTIGKTGKSVDGSQNMSWSLSEIGAAPSSIVGPYFVEGNSADNIAGTWTGSHPDITSYFDGLTIIYVPKIAGSSTTTLNINNLGATTCYYTGNNQLTTQYSVGTPILLTYTNNGWRRADFGNTDTHLRVYRQTDNSTWNKDYPLIASRTLITSINASNGGYTQIYGLIGSNANTPTINPITGELKAVKFTGEIDQYETGLFIGDNTNNKATVATTNGNTYIKLFDSDTIRSKYKISGSDIITVSTDGSGNITIGSTGNFSHSHIVTIDSIDYTIPYTGKVTLPNNRKTFYGTCATAAATAAKVVTLNDTTGWELKAGTIVGVKFTNTNSAGSITLNINSSGAKEVYYSGSRYTSTANWITGNAGKTIYYMYNGTQWEWLNVGYNLDSHYTTHLYIGAASAASSSALSDPYIKLYDNSTLRHQYQIKGEGVITVKSDGSGNITIGSTGQYDHTHIVTIDATDYTIPYTGKVTLPNNRKAFYGTCATAAATAAKVVTLNDTTGWELKAGTIVGVKFTNTNSAGSITLNVNSSGAKEVYYSGSRYTSTANWITGKAGKTIYYMYNGTQWEWLNTGYSLDSHYTTHLYIGAASAASSATQDNPYIKLFDNTSLREQYQIKGEGVITVKSDGSGNITISGTDTDTHYASFLRLGAINTTTNAATTNGNTYLKLIENGSVKETQIKVVGAGTVSVASDANGVLTITGGGLTNQYTTGLYIGEQSTSTNLNKSNVSVSNPYIKLFDDNTLRNQYRIIGSGATTVSTDGSGNITISSTDTNTDTHWTSGLRLGAINTTTNAATTNGNTYLKLIENGTYRSTQIKVVGTGNVTVTSDATGILTINGVEQDSSHYITSLIIGNSSNDKSTVATTNGNTYIKLFDDNTIRNKYKISGSDIITVTSDGSGNITIGSTGDFSHTHIITINGTNYTIPYSGSVNIGQYFAYRGNVNTAYVDLSVYTSGATGYQNLESGTYTISRSGYSEMLVEFRGSGSTSALEFKTSYGDTSDLFFRKTIDSNRVSGPWRKIITDANISTLFTQFANIGSQTTRITIGGTTHDLKIDADMTDGLHVHGGRNNEANKIVRTDGNGYIQAGWINTTSGAMGTGFDKIYVSNDSYIRYVTKADFLTGLNLYWANLSIQTALDPNTVPTFSWATFSRVSDHGVRAGTFRGLAVGSRTGEYIHMYERVHIGSPAGWGSREAPSYGLSTYGGAWLATDTGNVGIGTTSPGYKLDIVGSIRSSWAGQFGNVRVGGYNMNTVEGNANIEFLTGSGYIDWHYKGSTNDYTTRLIENSSGNLTLYGNLGLSRDPSYKLDVAGDTRISGNLYLGANDYNNFIAFYGTYGDGAGSYATSFIGEHLWGSTESSELLLMKFNDVGNNISGTTVASSGPDRIRHLAHAHVFQIMTNSTQGDFVTMANSTAYETKLEICKNCINSFTSIIFKGSTTNDMSYSGNVHPYIRFDNADSSQNVSFIFTDYDNYRSPAGIKLVGNQGGEWFEAPHIYSQFHHISHNSDDAVLLAGGGWKYISDFGTSSQLYWANIAVQPTSDTTKIPNFGGIQVGNQSSNYHFVMGTGSYTWFDHRNSSNQVVSNIVMYNGYIHFGRRIQALHSTGNSDWATDNGGIRVQTAETGNYYCCGIAANSSGYGEIQASQVGVGAIKLILNKKGGNVGIGTDSPATKLHVNGRTTITYNGDILHLDSTTSYSCVNYSQTSGALWSVGSNNSNQFYFWNNNKQASFTTIDINGLVWTKGSFRVQMDTNSSNAKDGLQWSNTSNVVIGSIEYHNTEQRVIINSIGSGSVWDDTFGKSSLRIGKEELTYNGFVVPHTYPLYVYNGTSTSSYWRKLGTFTTAGNSNNMIIDIFSGPGYNGTADQNVWCRIMIKDGWQSSPSVNNCLGITVEQFGYPKFSYKDQNDNEWQPNRIQVRVNVTSRPSNSQATGDLWILCPWDYANGNYTVSGHFAKWTHNGAAANNSASDGNQTSFPTHNQNPVQYMFNVSHMELGRDNLTGWGGSFFFGGNNTLFSGEDYVGLQAGNNYDKWQLVAGNGNLNWRQNDTGNTNTSFGSWRTILDTGNGWWANQRIQTASSTTTSPTFSTCYTSNWFRSTGNSGWYSESYGGGWWMTDSSWIRAYNNKNVYTGSGIIRSDNQVWGNKVCLQDNWIGFYSSQQGGTRYGYIQTADGNYMYFRKENGNSGFNFNGNLVPSGNNSYYLGNTGLGWIGTYLRSGTIGGQTRLNIDNGGPKIEFSNSERSQRIQLIYTDYDNMGRYGNANNQYHKNSLWITSDQTRSVGGSTISDSCLYTDYLSPSLDNKYTLGDPYHKWNDLFTEHFVVTGNDGLMDNGTRVSTSENYCSAITMGFEFDAISHYCVGSGGAYQGPVTRNYKLCAFVCDPIIQKPYIGDGMNGDPGGGDDQQHLGVGGDYLSFGAGSTLVNGTGNTWSNPGTESMKYAYGWVGVPGGAAGWNTGGGRLYFHAGHIGKLPSNSSQIVQAPFFDYEGYLWCRGTHTISDEHFKCNINQISDYDLSSMYEYIKNGGIKQYNMIDHEERKEEYIENNITSRIKKQYGVIAQELLNVAPECVVYEPFYDYYAVNYNTMYSMMIASLVKEIEKLKLKVNELENRLN